MRLTRLIVIAACLPVAALAATVQDEPSRTKPGKAVQTTDDERVICHTSAPIGSLIANRKECHTRRQWANMHVDTSHPLQGGSCSSAESGRCY